jgi:hypothetical protein
LGVDPNHCENTQHQRSRQTANAYDRLSRASHWARFRNGLRMQARRDAALH